MNEDALSIGALMGAKKRLEQIAYPELKPDEFVVGYTCKECGRVQPYLRECPHVGPDLLERYPGRVSVDVASIFEQGRAKDE